VTAIRKTPASNAEEFEKLVKKLDSSSKLLKKNACERCRGLLGGSERSFVCSPASVEQVLATDTINPTQHTYGYFVLL
jgi:hypothetical protein